MTELSHGLHLLHLAAVYNYGLFIGASVGAAFNAVFRRDGRPWRRRSVLLALLFAIAAVVFNRHGIGFGLLEESAVMAVSIAAAFAHSRKPQSRKTAQPAA